jgi:hypothetical protein
LDDPTAVTALATFRQFVASLEGNGLDYAPLVKTTGAHVNGLNRSYIRIRVIHVWPAEISRDRLALPGLASFDDYASATKSELISTKHS